jgi:predicted nuclease of predicted toxin-antitoxin system
MPIRFFVDENIGRNLVIGLRQWGYDNVEHIHDNFPPGTADEVWLEYVGKNGYVLITKDKKIRKHPKEKAALIKYKIVAFYLGGSEVGTRQMAKQIINAWDKMEACAAMQQRKGVAGAFRIPPRGGKIEEIPLT